ncbi:MAG: SDR family NAD(P)-dependent oxidoreductase [Magnetospirillum sp.]|nr:SDR family NAD(P)-dependent oxidoreductase [Magnetospirillum sp.]
MSPASILITGASSGLGAALARAYAAPGVALFLSGRNAVRLEAEAEACRSRGATVAARVLDVADRAGMAAWVAACDAVRPLDLVIANAGISAGTGGHDEPAAQARAIFAVNVDGTMNTVLPALDGMRPRRRGQVALMSSLASFRGFPGAPAYCASKAAVRVWGEGLRGWLAGEGIAVSVICPGFVVTGMTAANTFSMPLLMSAERAAAIIVAGLAANRGRIAFPWPLAVLAWAAAALPAALMDALGRWLPAKS